MLSIRLQWCERLTDFRFDWRPTHHVSAYLLEKKEYNKQKNS